MGSFPPPDVQAALKNPTVRTTDPSTGYQFDTTSPEWKAACAPLPSFSALQWPGYATTWVPANIDGMEVIIQPWMGLCEQFFSRGDYPGGFGGEVGVYVLVPDSRPLPDLQVLPGPLQLMFQGMAAVAGSKFCWPHPDMQPQIDFTIINPVANDVLLRADPENHYWVNKWMEPDSYSKYKADNDGKVPSWPSDYKMVYTVAGVTRTWTPSPSDG